MRWNYCARCGRISRMICRQSSQADYEKRMKEYMTSGDYRENDIEQLLVYFTFRYIMNAIYDSNIMV